MNCPTKIVKKIKNKIKNKKSMIEKRKKENKSKKLDKKSVFFTCNRKKTLFFEKHYRVERKVV
jgi:hypothetical protein